MFPKAEGTVILDVLAMVDNNVQKASEQLVRMGYEKKEMTPAPRLSHRKKEDQSKKEVVAQPTPPAKPKTQEEKKRCEKFIFRVMSFVTSRQIFSESSPTKSIQRFNTRENHFNGTRIRRLLRREGS